MLSEFLQERHLFGLVLGLCTFLIIGVFHPLVIKGEYYFGVKCWWAFAIAGVAMCGAAVYISDPFWSTLAGVVGFSCFWSIMEVFDQRKRVLKGWFPMNPKRADEYARKK